MSAPDRHTGENDLLSGLYRLQQQAQALVGRLDAASRAVSEASARDQTEQVRVVLDEAGQVASVEVATGWRARLEPAAVGAAVLAAYQEAGRRRLETWAAELDAGDSGAAVGGTPAGPTRPVTLETMTGPGPAAPSAQEAIQRLWYVLQDATDRLDDLAREFEDSTRRTVVGRDREGRVAATMTGGVLSGLEFDREWLTQATAARIGAAVTESVRAGQAAAAQAGPGSVLNRWPFDHLDRIAADPQQMLRDLGLA